MTIEEIEEYLEAWCDGTAFCLRHVKQQDKQFYLEFNGDNPCREDWRNEIIIDNPTTKKELTKILAD